MKKVGIVGSGLIGRSWAMLFAGGGYKVIMYDINKEALSKSYEILQEQLYETERAGMLRGSLSAKEQYELISVTSSLAEVVSDAVHVQECVFEDVELKKKVFRDICDYCNNDQTVLCSSTSCIMPSILFTGLPRVSQCIIAHPCNPPSLCPLTEIVPHPETATGIIEKTRLLMAGIGQTPVTLKKEVDGFALNRIQYAIINECWRLVLDGYMSVEDVDKVLTDGMGMRYAFIGPFETCHLNAEGTVQYMEKYAAGIKRVSSSFGPVPEFDAKSVAEISEQMCKMVPDSRESLEKRRKWRDSCLMELARVKAKVKTD